MKKISLILLLLFFAGAAGIAEAAPKGPAYLKSSVKKALLNAYAAEIQQYPKLKAYLEDESKQSFRVLFQKVRQYNVSKAREGKRKSEGLDDPGPIQSVFLNDSNSKQAFIQESGMKEWMIAASLPLTPAQTAKRALEEVFAEEIKDYPGLKGFLNNENNPPHKNALRDLEGLRDKDVASLKAAIQGTKNWYIRNTGIGDSMFENSNAPQDDETRREWMARTFPEDMPSGGGSESGKSGTSTPTLTLTDFTPKGGLPGTSVTLSGNNLGYVTGVLFNGLLVDGFSAYPSGMSLTTLVPPGATSGLITLTANSGNVTSSVVFEIWSGQCSNADLQKAFTQLSHTPNGEKNVGDCNIKKYNNGKYATYKELLGYVKNAVGFFKLPPPRIGRISPAFGPPGTPVTIEADSMDVYLDDIKFNGNSIPFRLVDSKTASITIPANASSGDKEIKIISDLHGEGKGSFKVAMSPEIIAVNPNPVEPVRSMSITGNYFNEITRVDMVHKSTDRLTQIKNFAKPSDNQLNITSPTDAGDYFLAVFGKYGRSQAVTFRVAAKPPPPKPAPEAEKVTVNSQGHPEYCFGAVGNGCGGFGENAGEASTRPAWLGAGCHGIKGDGTRDCWVAQGSIMHDNCCIVYPYGQNCGGKYADGSKASLVKHDGHCVKEWADAMWDVAHGHAWLENFKAKEPADITPISSARYGVGETPESARLCAPDKTNITDRSPNDALYCCAKVGQRYWAATPTVPPIIENWITCGPPPKKPWFGILSVDQKQKGKSNKAIRVDQPPPPMPVAYLEKLPPSKRKRVVVQPMARQPQPSFEEPLIAAPPPPPPPAAEQRAKRSAEPQIHQRQPEPMETKKFEAPTEGQYEAPEETVWRRPETPQEETPPQCERGEWSPTLKICVE